MKKHNKEKNKFPRKLNTVIYKLYKTIRMKYIIGKMRVLPLKSCVTSVNITRSVS